MAETETRPRRLPPETETLTIFLETRPRRNVGTSRDRDVETETTTLTTTMYICRCDCSGLEMRNDNVVRARANVIKTLATVSLFFVFCWAWNQTYYLMYYLGYPYVDFTSDFYNFTVIMVFLNCCVNPVIYSIRYDQVRRLEALATDSGALGESKVTPLPLKKLYCPFTKLRQRWHYISFHSN